MPEALEHLEDVLLMLFLIAGSHVQVGVKQGRFKRFFKKQGENGAGKNLKKILAAGAALAFVTAGAAYYFSVYKPQHTDSDKDGLSDWDEIHKYKTNPHNPDTDNDHLIDSQDTHPLKFNPYRIDFKENGRSVDNYFTPQTWDDVELISMEETERRLEESWYVNPLTTLHPALIERVENKVKEMDLTDNWFLVYTPRYGWEKIPGTWLNFYENLRENSGGILIIQPYKFSEDPVIRYIDLVMDEVNPYSPGCVAHSFNCSYLLNRIFREKGINAEAWTMSSQIGDMFHQTLSVYDRTKGILYDYKTPFENSMWVYDPGNVHILQYERAIGRWGNQLYKGFMAGDLLQSLNWHESFTFTDNHTKWLANYMLKNGFDNKLYEEVRRIQSVVDSDLIDKIFIVENIGKYVVNENGVVLTNENKPLIENITVSSFTSGKRRLVVLGGENPVYLIVDEDTFWKVYSGDRAVQEQLENKYL